MFLRTNKVKGQEHLVLVESYRDSGRVRQRVIHWFGRKDQQDWTKVRSELWRCPGFAYLRPENPA